MVKPHSLLIFILEEVLRLMLTSVTSLKVSWEMKKFSSGKETSFLEREKALSVQCKKDLSATTSTTRL